MYLDTLELLEHFPGSKDKESLIAKSIQWDTDLPLVLDAALNFSRKYFLKQLPTLVEPAPIIGGHLPELLELLKRLETRQVTGDAAKAAVKELFDRCTTLERKWFQRILLKDLRCGFGISTCTNAGVNIPEFEVQLAKDAKKCKKLNEIIKKGVWVSKKFDGYRCLAVVEDGVATLYSRNGVVYENFPTIQQSLVNACAGRTDVVVFDGEIMSDNFQSMQQSAFASKRQTTVGDVKYHIFDWIPGVEWETQKFAMKAGERFKKLDEFFGQVTSPLLVKVDHEWSEDINHILKLERDFLALGYEGAMVINDIAYYLGRKSNAMLKFKTMLSMDCKILEVCEGEGKYQGTLGSLKLSQENGKICSVGSGFSDEERDQIWRNPSAAIGRTAEIQYQNLSDDGVMRFPVMKRYRDDK